MEEDYDGTRERERGGGEGGGELGWSVVDEVIRPVAIAAL